MGVLDVELASSIDRLCASVLDGTAQPHDLPPLLHDLWRDGFHMGRASAQARIDRLEREADSLYFELHNPAEVRAERDKWLRHFEVMEYRSKWKAGAA